MINQNNLKYIDDYTISNPHLDDEYYERAIIVRQKLENHTSIAHMGQIVTSSKERSIIGTMALDTCFGIVFYDRKNKFGIVGHASASGKIGTLQEMINLLNKDENLTIEYAIVPGYRNEERKDYSGVNELMEYLRSNCPSNITLVPFKGDLGIQLHTKTYSYEFAFEVNSCLPVSQYLFYDGTLESKFYK